MIPLYRCKICGTEFPTETPLAETQIADIFRSLNAAPFNRANSPIQHFMTHNCGTHATKVTGIAELIGFTSNEVIP